jgi:hypothetical protein
VQGSRRWVALGAWAVLASFLTAIPAAAAGPVDPPAAKTTRLHTTLSAATLASLAPARAAEQDANGGSTSFFKTRKGVAVLVLMGAGLGYTLYSKNHDRVTSPVR